MYISSVLDFQNRDSCSKLVNVTVGGEYSACECPVGFLGVCVNPACLALLLRKFVWPPSFVLFSKCALSSLVEAFLLFASAVN